MNRIVTRIALIACGTALPALAQNTTFNYQGLLKDSGATVSGQIDVECLLYDADTGGTQIGATLSANNVDVVDGLFTVDLDFGAAALNGGDRWLEIAVANPAGGSFTTLSPRQPLTAAPYAIQTRGIAVDDLGRVGIGTDTPSSPLEVAGSVRCKGPGAGFHIFNPNNPGASAHFSWLNDTARIRVGGSGPGANGGFSLQRVGDQTLLRVTDNGRLGVGTASPTATLDVRGRLVLEDGGDALVYTAASGGEQGRYLKILNSTTVASASGLMAGGVLVSDDYNYASPSKTDLIVKGNVGIGTAAPEASLEIEADGDDRAVRIAHSDDVPNVVTIERTVDCYFAADILELKAQAGSHPTAQFIECEMPGDFKFRVWTDGDVTADGTITGGGADFAEMVRVPSGADSVEAGDVMVIDVNNPSAVVRSSESRSTLVAGIYSTKPGYLASEHDWDQLPVAQLGIDPGGADDEVALKPLELGRMINEIPLAVVGIVPCKVSAENGAIRPGDLLVTSNTPGHAMRDDAPRNGTIVGKALGALDSGAGVVKVLVTLQ